MSREGDVCEEAGSAEKTDGYEFHERVAQIYISRSMMVAHAKRSSHHAGCLADIESLFLVRMKRDAESIRSESCARFALSGVATRCLKNMIFGPMSLKRSLLPRRCPGAIKSYVVCSQGERNSIALAMSHPACNIRIDRAASLTSRAGRSHRTFVSGCRTNCRSETAIAKQRGTRSINRDMFSQRYAACCTISRTIEVARRTISCSSGYGRSKSFLLKSHLSEKSGGAALNVTIDAMPADIFRNCSRNDRSGRRNTACEMRQI